jgi:hypothetical protein
MDMTGPQHAKKVRLCALAHNAFPEWGYNLNPTRLWEGSVVSITETGAIAVKTGTVSLAPSNGLLARLGSAWPATRIGLAVIVHATWIGCLGYGLSKLF